MPPQHARLALTISERLDQVELDMSVVHNAVARLSDRLDLVERAIQKRDQSHVEVISAQVDRADQMLAFLRDENTHEQPAAPSTEHASALETEFAEHDPGLLG